MEVIYEKTINDLSYRFESKAANQSANEQLEELYLNLDKLNKEKLKFKDEPIRRPSEPHKLIKRKIKKIRLTIKEVEKAILKCNALKAANIHIGKTHGGVIFNKTKYSW